MTTPDIPAAGPVTVPDLESLTAAIAAADLLWSAEAGDPPSEPRYTREVAELAWAALARTAAPAAEPAPDRVRIAAIIGPAMGHERFDDEPDCTSDPCTHGGHETEAGCDACAGPGWPCDVALGAADAVLRALAGAGAPTEPADDGVRGYIIARFRDATDQHGDLTLDYWDDDVHRTEVGAFDHYLQHVDDEHGEWELYELRRLPNPRAALAGSADDTREGAT